MLQNLTESFWKRIKFALLFILTAAIIYILLTKTILKIPVADSQALLASITEFEEVIENEKKLAVSVKKLSEDIKVMDFDIYQVQKQDDIKREIFRVQSYYKDYNMSSKYKFGIQAKKVLEIYYHTREKNGKLKYNIDLLTKNLTECQANL